MVSIPVEGMSCGHCAAAIKKAILAAAPGSAVEVDLEAGEVRVVGPAEPPVLRQAIQDAGYTPRD